MAAEWRGTLGSEGAGATAGRRQIGPAGLHRWCEGALNITLTLDKAKICERRSARLKTAPGRGPWVAKVAKLNDSLRLRG